MIIKQSPGRVILLIHCDSSNKFACVDIPEFTIVQAIRSHQHSRVDCNARLLVDEVVVSQPSTNQVASPDIDLRNEALRIEMEEVIVQNQNAVTIDLLDR